MFPFSIFLEKALPHAHAAVYEGFNAALPGNIATTSDPAGIVVNLYQFGMLLAGILAFGIIVWAGIQYSVSRGNPGMQRDARDRIFQAFFGILLLVGAYLILATLNPGLTQLQLPNLAPIEQGLTGEGTSSFQGGVTVINFSSDLGTDNATLPPGGGNKCSPPLRVDNYCAPSRLRAAGCNFPNETAANQLSAICKYESGGGNNPAIPSSSDRCRPGGEPVSWGIFQINLSAGHKLNGKPCGQAFDKPWTLSSPSCRIVNQTLYNECKAIATNAAFNLKFGCALYNDNGFRPWTCTARECSFMGGSKCRIPR